MAIWLIPPDRDKVNRDMIGTMGEHIGIAVTEIGDDYLKATMPVDERTQQYMGIVHGGASVALAETAGSIAASLCCRPGYYALGLDINANHIRPGRPPHLEATTRPLHIGGSTMVWEILIQDAQQRLVCASRLTMAVLRKNAR